MSDTEDTLVPRIVAFIERIGIAISADTIDTKTFLPGLDVRHGALVYDIDKLKYPGDLLHEAGHIALTDPADRNTHEDVSEDPAQEIAAIPWSYAAALEIGIDPAIVFHPKGYKGQSRDILAAFAAGNYFGVPLLQWYGLTAEPKNAEATGVPAFPKMTRWLR
jgi:hypothetical protein